MSNGEKQPLTFPPTLETLPRRCMYLCISGRETELVGEACIFNMYMSMYNYTMSATVGPLQL